MKSSKLLFVLLLFLTGCAVGPNYQTPDVTMPTSFTETKTLSEEDQIELSSWWLQFNDSGLNVFIHEAISQNLDLKSAYKKIQEMRAHYKLEAAELFPKIDLNAEETRSRISQNLFDSTFLGPPYQNFYSIGFDASWEIDIFGKRRRMKEAAFYDYQAEVENARDVYITLLSDVARHYIEIRSLQQQVSLLKRKIYVQSELLKLTDEKLASGLDSEITMQDFKAELEKNQSSLPPLQGDLKSKINALAVLLGKPPEDFSGTFETTGNIPVSAHDIPIGLPSDLLRRRPDIRQAERQLAAATANIGAAVADLFPRFSLFGGYGFQSNRSNRWFKANSRTWSIGPSVDWPILYFGRIRENIRVQNSIQEQALLHYEQTILQALQDVENSLIGYYQEEERKQRLEDEIESLHRIYELKRDLYLAGLENFQSFLEADQNLISAQMELSTSTETVSTKLVAVFKSLGGEW